MIDKNTIGDIVLVKTNNKLGMYSSRVLDEGTTIITKTIFEAKSDIPLKELCKDMDIDYLDDGEVSYD